MPVTNALAPANNPYYLPTNKLAHEMLSHLKIVCIFKIVDCCVGDIGTDEGVGVVSN